MRQLTIRWQTQEIKIQRISIHWGPVCWCTLNTFFLGKPFPQKYDSMSSDLGKWCYAILSFTHSSFIVPISSLSCVTLAISAAPASSYAQGGRGSVQTPLDGPYVPVPIAWLHRFESVIWSIFQTHNLVVNWDASHTVAKCYFLFYLFGCVCSDYMITGGSKQ